MRKKSPPALKNDYLGEYEHLRDRLDIMNVTLRLIDVEAFILYKPMNEPVMTVGWGDRHGKWTSPEVVMAPPLPSKRPWRLYRAFGAMGAYATFDAVTAAYNRIIDEHHGGN